MGVWTRGRGAARASRVGLTGLVTATLVAGLSPGAQAEPLTGTAPEDETIWETGQVTGVSDGDTLTARLVSGPGQRGDLRIRTIGVQAPEVSHSGNKAQCGAAQAKTALRDQLPKGAQVQTRSVEVTSRDQYSGGRIARSLYALDSEGNWYDTSRSTVSDGWMMWFPLAADSRQKAEWAHNLEYRVLADEAQAKKRGLWSANLCGTARYPNLNLRIWAKYWGTEQVWVQNNGTSAVDLSKWIIRDAGIKATKTLPAGTVIPAGSTRLIFTGDLNLNNLPTKNNAFEGDAVYLMEPASSKLSTGNLRAWFPYPCNPDECTDPLRGKVKITSIRSGSPAEQPPSAPGSVRAQASTDGSGRVTVTWAAAQSPGSDDMTYTVTARAVDGGAAPQAITGVTGTQQVVSGLTLGRAYTFTVQARNPKGSSSVTAATAPVSPIGLPSAPGTPTVDVRGTTAVVSWRAPAVAGTPVARYDVIATTGAGVPTPGCTTANGATSCVLTGLTVGRAYVARVRATLGSSVTTSAPVHWGAVAPAAGTGATPLPPAGVAVQAGDGRAVVSWTAPDQRASGPVTGYTATVTATDGRTATCVAAVASCVVTGLRNGTAVTARVTAWRPGASSAASAASASAVPAAHVARRAAGPTAAPPVVANPWIGGEIVEVTNTSASAVKLGGYGLWDLASAESGSSNQARLLFPATQTLAARASLLVHIGTTPGYRPPAPAGKSYLWTGVSTFINARDDYVELNHLNTAQVSCLATPGGTCRGTTPVSASTSPVGVTAQTGATRVTVSWGAPISRGGTAITGYVATAYSSATGGTVLARCATGGGGRSCSFPARTGTTYHVDVVAQNAQGWSGPSWRVRATPHTAPSAPRAVSATPSPGGLSVRWSAAAANGRAIAGYTARAYSAATGGTVLGSCSTAGAQLTGCTISGLRGGLRAYVDVTASNQAGVGPRSSPRAAGTPAVVRSVSTVVGRKVVVRWQSPAPAGTSPLGFTARIWSKATGGKLLGSCTAGPAQRTCTTGTLAKQGTYYVDLITATGLGAIVGAPRQAAGAPAKPGTPTVTSTIPTPARRIVVSWAAPASTGSLPFSAFQAGVFTKASGGSLKAACPAAGTALSCPIAVLPRGTYWVAARAANAQGWSGWSSRVKVVVR